MASRSSHFIGRNAKFEIIESAQDDEVSHNTVESQRSIAIEWTKRLGDCRLLACAEHGRSGLFQPISIHRPCKSW